MLVVITLFLYRLLFWATSFYWKIFLRNRIKNNKEDELRWLEKIGKTSLPPPKTKEKIIWANAVSVGEALSVIPLIEELLKMCSHLDGEVRVLLTTSTKTSADIVKDKLPPNAFHQYMVLDHPLYVKRFLKHWKPSAAIYVESELWPNLIVQTAKLKIPLVLINARLSPKTVKNWLRVKWFISFLLSHFNICLAQTPENKDSLISLGAKNVVVGGNLKYDVPPLLFDEGEFRLWQSNLSDLKVFFAASTHNGEDEYIIKSHKNLCQQGKKIQTIIAPRHPQRAAKIADLASKAGMSSAFHSSTQSLDNLPDIYIVDEIGTMGLFYKLADIVFIGGSLIDHGSQNPLEAARLNCALISGRHFFNFENVYQMLQQNNAIKITDAEKLTENVASLLDDENERKRMVMAAVQSAENLKGALAKNLHYLKPILEKI